MSAEAQDARRRSSVGDSEFQCNICLEPVQDAVVTQCGHLYCWGCLYQWLNMGRQSCPVCKAGVTRENIIPLYTSGSGDKASHPASADHAPQAAKASTPGAVPPRPTAPRPAQAAEPASSPQPSTHTGTPGQWGNTQVFMGFGLFPSLMGLHFHTMWGGAGTPPPTGAPPQPQSEEERHRAQAAMFMQMLALVITVFLLFY